MSSENVVLVTGGTGSQGGATVTHLSAGKRVRDQKPDSGCAEYDSPNDKPENLAHPNLCIHKASVTTGRVLRRFF